MGTRTESLKLGPIELGRVRLLTLREQVPAATAFVRHLAANFNLSADDLTRLELAVEEACLNVVQHAYTPGEVADYEVIVERRPVQLVVSIVDRGVPVDPARPAGMGNPLMRYLVEEVRVKNLGRQGKRRELIRSIPYENVQSYFGLKAQPSETPEVDETTPVTCRLMVESDAPGLARCVYRSYRYSYVLDTVYYPERVQDLRSAGLMISAVAVTDAGEVVGHLALTRSSTEEKVPDCGQAVVDPRFRGRGLFTDLKRLLVEEARGQGFYGLYSEAVTIHPYTQMGNLKLGASEVGVQLAFVPQEVNFQAIGRQSERQAVILTYLPVQAAPIRQVYAPPRHRAMLERIYQQAGLERELADPPAFTPGELQVDLSLRQEMGFAFFKVHDPGKNLAEHMSTALRRDRGWHHDADVIYLDLPLSHPGTPQACSQLEELGFFFLGVVPELAPGGGDILRLQLLKCEIHPGRIVAVSDFAKELLAYVLACGGLKA